MHQAQTVAGTQQWDILDWSAIIASSRVAAGLDPFDSAKVCLSFQPQLNIN